MNYRISLSFSITRLLRFWLGGIKFILWRRKWQPTPVFLPGKSHEQRILVEYSPWDLKESETTEHAHTCAHTDTHHTHTAKFIDWLVENCRFNNMGFPSGSDSEESACNAGDPGSIPGLGRFLGEGNGNPLQYSCLENPMDREAWWATVHGVTKSWTWLSD